MAACGGYSSIGLDSTAMSGVGDNSYANKAMPD